MPVPKELQADSGTAAEAITHSVGCIAGACPLAIPYAFAHGVGAAASIILGAGVQELTGPDAIPTVTLAAAAGDLLGACGDTFSMQVAASMVDETAVNFLAQFPITSVAVLTGTCPLPRCHLGAVGVRRAAPMIMGTRVHL